MEISSMTNIQEESKNYRVSKTSDMLLKQEQKMKKQILYNKLEEMLIDAQDIHFFLEAKLSMNAERIGNIEKELQNHIKKKNGIKLMLMSEFDILEKQHRYDLESLEEKSQDLKMEFVQMEKVETKKKTLIGIKHRLQHKLEKNRLSHAKKTLALDRTNIKNKEKLKRSMVIKMRRTEEELQVLTPHMLQQKKEKERIRRLSLAETLRYCSMAATETMQKNHTVQRRSIQTKQKLDITLSMDIQATARKKTYQRMITELNDTLTSLAQHPSQQWKLICVDLKSRNDNFDGKNNNSILESDLKEHLKKSGK